MAATVPASVMDFQLREYTIEAGKLDDFVREWRELVLPLRVSLGFSIFGPWVEREANGFVWIVGYEGDIQAANDAYYSSPERAAMDPDPARLVVESRHVLLQAP
jgi:hypothetical protein